MAHVFFFSWSIFFPFIFISWRLITLQYCSGFCCTLTWIMAHVLYRTCMDHWQAIKWLAAQGAVIGNRMREAGKNMRSTLSAGVTTCPVWLGLWSIMAISMLQMWWAQQTGTTGQPTQCLGGAKRRFQTRSKEAEAGDGAGTVGTGLPRWC